MTNRTMLVVDDDAEILASMADLLAVELPAVRVLTATSPLKALEICKRERPSLIVADYKMAEMDGIEFLRRTLDVVPEARRLMMSAYADPSVAARAVSDVDVAFLITKPFQLAYFVELVGSLLKQGAPRRPR